MSGFAEILASNIRLQQLMKLFFLANSRDHAKSGVAINITSIS